MVIFQFWIHQPILYGLRLGEEIEIEIETGKTLIVKLTYQSANRELMEQEWFTLN